MATNSGNPYTKSALAELTLDMIREKTERNLIDVSSRSGAEGKPDVTKFDEGGPA